MNRLAVMIMRMATQETNDLTPEEEIIRRLRKFEREIAKSLLHGNDVELRWTYKGLTATALNKKRVI